MFPQKKNIGCGQGGQLWQKKLGFGTQGAVRTNFARKRGKKDVGLKSARISQEHTWDSQMVWHPPCTDFAGEKKRDVGLKVHEFPRNTEIGTESAQLSWEKLGSGT